VFVFTDVQSSTNLWGSDSVAMNQGLTLHDNIMRELLKRFRGYEVKTEGDAFMVIHHLQPAASAHACKASTR
jgi:adenylate cyclase